MARTFSSSGLRSWQALASTIGGQVISDIKNAIATHGPGRRQGYEIERGVRHFLHWLVDNKCPVALKTLKILCGTVDDLDDRQAVGFLVAAFGHWVGVYAVAAGLSNASVRSYARSVGATLEWLSLLPGKNYPPFRRRFVSLPHVAGAVSTLAGLKWPELDRLAGAAAERHGLMMVRNAALAEFEVYERLFHFGQRMLAASSEPKDVDAVAWRSIRSVLMAERQSWMTRGMSLCAPGSAIGEEVAPLLETVNSRDTWLSSGLPVEVANVVMPPKRPWKIKWVRAPAVLGCLGATRQASAMALTVFACDTGWNRQPIIDLPREPFLFRGRSQYGVATSGFVHSFKIRAHREVLAYLEAGDAVPEMAEEIVQAEWSATANAFDPSSTNEGYAVLDGERDKPLIDLIGRFQSMTDAIRPFDLRDEHKDHFFVYLTPNYGLYRKASLTISECARGGVLARKGVGFQTIRKTYLALKYRETGSVGAVRYHAGQVSNSVLMPHYLNTDDIKAELDESIRFFQSVLQSLVLDGREEAALAIGSTAEDVQWFRKMAYASGIAAAVGLVEVCTTAPPREFVFRPETDNLKDLFLTHWALRRTQSQTSRARWRVQGLPLLAAVKAIGRALCSKGLRSAYWSAARRAHAELRTGRSILPPVLVN